MSASAGAVAAEPSGIFSVAGRSVIVTGATGAFGSAAARAFAQAGAQVTICAGNVAGLAELASGLRAAGGRVAVHAERPDSPAAAQAIVDAFPLGDIPHHGNDVIAAHGATVSSS